jgi:very-short-patch-repair endonuclease
MTVAANLLSKLLDYVVEQSKVVDPHGFKLAAHKGFLKDRDALAGLPGVDFDIKVEGDHTWLRVARLEALPPPQLSESVRGLVHVSQEPGGSPPSVNEPALAHRVAAGAAGKTSEQFQQESAALRAMVDTALARYAPLWTAWAAGEKPRRRTIDLYGDLFALKHQLEAEETAKPQELVWGLGVSAWKLKDEAGAVVDFQYPLLTQAMEIAVEDESLAILVRPRGVDPRFEFDAFSACRLTSAPEVETAAKKSLVNSADRPVTPFDTGSFEPVLKLVAGNLHERGRYLGGQTQLPVPGDELVVTDAWVVLSRPRSNNFLHEDIQRLKQRIAEGCALPVGAEAFVTAPSDEQPNYEPIAFRGLSGAGSGAAGTGKARELFFPLPYNHEQITIVEQLERSDGVVVQGPPGTGKTHTIANIVCHYLATGRKVLVTSKGEQALEVLQSKIPEAVRPLTVALLSGDREGMRQFQNSIESIIHVVSQLNPEVAQAEIDLALSSIEQAHTELAVIDRRVDEIALSQLSDINVDGVQMRAQKMAELVIAGNDRHGWFDDVLTLAPEHAPPVTASEVNQGREARRRVASDLVYASARTPSSLALPAAADIGNLHNVLLGMREIEAAEASGGLLALRSATPEVLALARSLLSSVDTAAQLAHELEETGQVWTAHLRGKCRLPDFASERQALEALFNEIEELVRARAEFLKSPVELPEAALGTEKFSQAVDRAAETGKPFGLLALGVGDAKAHVAAVRVAGLQPKTDADWKHVKRYLQLHDRVRSFSVRWNQFAATLSIPTVTGGVQGLREIELVATYARKAHLLATNHDAHLPVLAERVFASPPIKELRGTSAEIRKVGEHLRSHLTRADLAQAAVMLATLQEKLAGTSGPVSEQLREFTTSELGAKDIATERVVARYAELVAEVRRIEGLAGDLDVINALASRLELAGAARFAARVRSQPLPAAGEDTSLPAAWREAWNWARIKTHLDSIEARDELLTIAGRRRDLERGLARLYENMVSKSAWRSTKLGASARVLSALEAYRTAIRRIGQGTGPNASRYRRDAQKAMHDAQGAVPCWVMSHSKVSETLPAVLGSFDLVVVDEASQSDLWALPAVLRGKKILVVGDDKQVSPDGGFISAAQIQVLVNRFLGDQPHAASLTPEKSLYDMASTVFAANKVMLREHFRCVPAIIAYSNRFYNDSMQPLRIPRESERIDPPLVDIFVPSGYRDKKDLNRPEAEAIAAEIQALLADERFAARTLGVVSLLGPEQAKYIDTLVRSRCDGAELIHRKFKCGDARVFQGSERDIMFLSVVADPKGCKALSGNMFEQRFNVAASRARDRMYLVRSVEMRDLSQADLRAGLLGHFNKPLDATVDESKSLIGKCESGFERQVYTELFERGYRVIPQVKAGSFFIDFVVEGANDTRLALECDGDEFHGPDRWAADMNRQRVLERAGWTFWRCFASTWSLRKDEVLDELLERLAAMELSRLERWRRFPRSSSLGCGTLPHQSLSR